VLRLYLQGRSAELSEESRQTLEVNPLRVLDSKRDVDRAVVADAPQLLDHLCDACRSHFDRVRSGLDVLGLAHEVSPRLVRGLDYYNRTTFEFAGEALEGAQNAVGGGGRYDRLAEDLGGPPTPGIGFGAGVERILLACDAEGVFGEPASSVDVWVVDVTGGREALLLTHELRDAGVRADRSFEGRSMKAQMKAAGRSGARIALIVGEQEVADELVTVRPLRGGEHGEQEAVGRADVVDHVRKMLL
jgi:histidyl-tRNA synthetase